MSDADGVEAGVPSGNRLRRELGFWDVAASGVGLIVGAGIYVLVGAATAHAGAAVWASFMLAAVLAALTAASYAELAAMYPKAGAEYDYTRPAFPKVVAFLVGWMMLAGLTVAAAAVSLGFANYLGEFVDVDARVPAIILIIAVAGVALTGIERAMRVVVVLSLVQVGGLLFVIVAGVPHLGEHDLIHADGFTGILSGAALVFFAFIGFDEVTTLAEETRRPSRTIPLALFAALGVSTVLYIGVAIASVSILGADALAASDRPLADALADSVGGPAAKLVAAVAMVSTTNTTLMVLTAASRVVYGIASDAALPPVFANVGRRSAVPVPALVACTAVAAAFVLLDDIETVAGVTDVAVYAVFVAVNVAVIVLRLRKPETPRPFRIPLSVRRIPVVPIAALAAAVLLMTRISFDSVAIGAGAAALGALLWWFARPARRRAEESLARARAGGVDT